MAAELTPQQFRQVYREAEPGTAHAGYANPVAYAPDAEWMALVANPGPPPIPRDAAIPVNAFAGRLAPEEHVVAMAPGTSFANSISQLLERAGEAT